MQNQVDGVQHIRTNVGDTESFEVPLNFLEDEGDSKAQIAAKINKLETYIAKAQARIGKHEQKISQLRQKITGNKDEIKAALAVNHLDPNVGAQV